MHWILLLPRVLFLFIQLFVCWFVCLLLGKIGEVMKKTIKKMEVEDEVSRERKHKDHLRYQRELDSQVTNIRARSINALKGALLTHLSHLSLPMLCVQLFVSD